MKARKRSHSIEFLKQRYGYMFVAPWIFGLLVFFFIPLISSLYYSFCNISITGEGVKATFVGLEHYRNLFEEDAQYLNHLRDSLLSILYSLPIILSLSLILAIVLNQKFVGRVVARAIFFLPVIIASGVVMSLLKSEYVRVPLFFDSTSSAALSYSSMIDFEEVLGRLNLSAELIGFFSTTLNNVFGLIWSCGVQTVLFISGLQTIPASLYEVSKVEGASKWEEFWSITFPMLRHVVVLVIIYTMIELFTSVDNAVMSQAYTVMNTSQVYDRSSAMMWLYFVLAGLFMGGVMLLYNRFCLKRWD